MSLVYLRDVLGLEQWIATPGEIPAARSVLASVIRIRKGWVTAERALVEKILTATGLHGIPTVADEPVEARHVIVFDTEAPPARVVSGESVTWNLGPLRALMDGPAASVQSAKRDVWNLLKQFKEESGV